MIKMRSRLVKIWGAGLFVILALGTGYWWLSREQGPIYELDYERDRQEIIKIFDRDHYWLTPRETIDTDIWLKHRAPHEEDPRYFGKLQVKVLREHEQFVGFTAYYMKYPTLGSILFVAVNPEFRGKRYGEQLVHYALKDLKSQGAKQVQLVTRTDNKAAQNLYKRIGFYESSTSDGYVHFTKDL